MIPPTANLTAHALQSGDLLDAARLALDLQRPGNFLAIAKQALAQAEGERMLASLLQEASPQQLQVPQPCIWYDSTEYLSLGCLRCWDLLLVKHHPQTSHDWE